MTDWGRAVSFGFFLIPDASNPLIETARRVENLGLDLIGIQDHPYQRRFVDTFSLLAAIATATSRVTLFPDVANLPLRPPAMIAKASASIDILSDGRFELGLGAGGFWDAIEAFGGPRRSPGQSLAALEEAITVIRKLWSGERNLRFEGSHYRLAGAQSGPVPPHPIGVWLGAYGPRALDLTARTADGWVPSFRGELDKIVEMANRLDEATVKAGRDPSEIRRILNVGGSITDGPSTGPFQGPVVQWVDQLTEMVLVHGFDTFILWAEGEGQLDRFAGEVAPAVKEQVSRERN
jgi:alkanesulfonate monooxygenase SsuD/methylene tetrahydromethanopterin reductase-like flavin-dependent oxidoreductase (luciferase family)